MTDFPPISPESRAHNPEDKVWVPESDYRGACKQSWGTRKGSGPIPPSRCPRLPRPRGALLRAMGKLINLPPQESEPPLDRGSLESALKVPDTVH